MRSGRPKQPVALEPADKEKLELLARRPKTAQRAALRAKIILRAAEGQSNLEIARCLAVTGNTVGKWRERFRLRGRIVGRASAGNAAPDHRCPSGRGRYPDPGERSEGGDPLEHAIPGQAGWIEPECCCSPLAQLRVATPPERDVPVVH